MTQEEREEINARMLELYGYTLDDCEAVGRKANRLHKNKANQHAELPQTIERLRYRYGSYVVASRKHMGAGRGVKEYYAWQWRDYRGYMNELRELFPTEYALQLCRDEHSDLMSDMWWDVDGYRAEHIRAYRDRIKEIRLNYGLSKSRVAEFMRV